MEIRYLCGFSDIVKLVLEAVLRHKALIFEKNSRHIVGLVHKSLVESTGALYKLLGRYARALDIAYQRHYLLGKAALLTLSAEAAERLGT